MITKCKNSRGVYYNNNSKLKGFTLIELLAVIVILAVIALIATPIILKVVENSKRNALKDTTYALVDAATNYVQMKEIKGQKVEWTTNKITGEKYKSFNLSNKEDVKELNVKGDIPEVGRVEVTSKGKTFVVAIDNKLCAKKDYENTFVNLLSLNKDDICMLTASTSDVSSEEANDIISTVTKLNSKIQELEKKDKELETENNTLKKMINNDDKENNTFLLSHPVGSIYITNDSTNPSETYGGTWEAYGRGRTLVGVDKDKEQYNESNKQGGSNSVTLAASQIPSLNVSGSTGTGTSGSTGSGYSIGHTYAWRNTTTNGSHTHGFGSYANGFVIHATGGSNWSAGFAKTSRAEQMFYRGMDAAGNHYHQSQDYYANSISGVQAHTHSVPSLSVSGKYKNSNSGERASSINVQDEYITVYMWKRTA